MMNKKAAITKEVNAKHVKILEGLLKLPENKECADCKIKAPRWASINLGIFICLQCSGIHRSLGVHISKVRSATLDIWLPEQVAFMQSMGNEKSNAYWEAELPLDVDRGRIENFIRLKYAERKWISRDDKVKSPPRSVEQLASAHTSTSESSSSIPGTERQDSSIVMKQHAADSSGNSSSISTGGRKDDADYNTDLQLQKKEKHLPSADGSISQVKAEQIVPDTGPNESIQKTKPAASDIQSSTASANPVVPSPKVDYATELFRMLSMDDSTESDSSPTSDMSSWVDFDTADEEEIKGGQGLQTSSTCKVQPETKIEDVRTSIVPETKGQPQKYQKDAINVNQPRPEEPNKALASSYLRGQLAPPVQGRSFTTVATGISHCGSQPSPHSIHQQHVNNSLPQSAVNARCSINHTPGTQLPMLYIPPAKFGTAPYTTSSIYSPAKPLNGVSTTPARMSPAALPVSGYDYDFSFLTQGMLKRH